MNHKHMHAHILICKTHTNVALNPCGLLAHTGLFERTGPISRQRVRQLHLRRRIVRTSGENRRAVENSQA